MGLLCYCCVVFIALFCGDVYARGSRSIITDDMCKILPLTWPIPTVWNLNCNSF